MSTPGNVNSPDWIDGFETASGEKCFNERHEIDALQAQLAQVTQERDANEMAMQMCGELRRILRDEFGYTEQPAFLCDAVRLAITEAERERDRLLGALEAILNEFDSPGDDRDPVVVIARAALSPDRSGEDG